MKMDALGVCQLFQGIPDEERSSLLSCLQALKKEYKRGEILVHTGQTISRFGILISGCLHIIKEDHRGNTAILAQISPGELFGEAFVCAASSFTVTVSAEEDSFVLWLEYSKILFPCSKNCKTHRELISNLVRILSQRNIFLTGRVEHLSQRTLREKVLSYLEELSRQQNSRDIMVPLNRQAMADYLGADRSALSAVLSAMARDGMIIYQKNHFTLL